MIFYSVYPNKRKVQKGVPSNKLLAHLYGDMSVYHQNGLKKPSPNWRGNVHQADIATFGPSDNNQNIYPAGKLLFVESYNNFDDRICIFIPEATRYFYQVLSSNSGQGQGMATKLLDGMITERIYGFLDPYNAQRKRDFKTTQSNQFFLCLEPGTRVYFKWQECFDSIGLLVYDHPGMTPHFNDFESLYPTNELVNYNFL